MNPSRGLLAAVILGPVLGLIWGCGSGSQSAPANCQAEFIGATECSETSECESKIREWLALEMAGPVVRVPESPEPMVESGGCMQVTVIAGNESTSGLACECQLSPGGGSLSIGPQGLGCFAVGRAGHCLWDDSEFEGCELGDDPLCDQVCDRLLERRLEDDSRTFETELIQVACTDGFSCASVAQVDDQCFVNQQWAGSAPCDQELPSTTCVTSGGS